MGNDFTGLYNFIHATTAPLERLHDRVGEVPGSDPQYLKRKKAFLRQCTIAMDSYVEVVKTIPKKRLTPGMRLILDVLKMEEDWAMYYRSLVGWTPTMHQAAFKKLTRLSVKIVNLFQEHGSYGYSAALAGDLIAFQFRYLTSRLATLRDQYFRDDIECMVEYVINRGGSIYFHPPKVTARFRYIGPLVDKPDW